MAKMQAIVVSKPGGPLVAEEREIPTPGAEEVRIRVHACGVCHSDYVTVQGLFPFIRYPRIPGHEVVGVIDALGPDVRAGGSENAQGSAGLAGLAAIAGAAGATAAFACENVNRDHGRDPRRRLRHSYDRPRLCGGARSRRSRRRRVRALCYARASRLSTRCATAARGPAMPLPSMA